MNEMTDDANNSENIGGPLASYEEARDWITGLVRFGIRPGMERVNALLERLGNPQRRLKFIHVAGTNGKGSVCAYLTHTLLQSGYDVGTYTSPYITKFTNRFQYNGSDIEETILLKLANELKPQVEDIAGSELGSPTMFEVSTVLAILFFSREVYPDYVVWETGLGGRMDVTNIVTPVVSVITNVGHDHMDILGDSLSDIAREKAGIIKPGVPVVSSVEQPEAIEQVRLAAKLNRSTLYLLNEQFSLATGTIQENEQSFSFAGPFRALDELTITLSGAHQRKNAALAVMTLEVLRQYYALVIEDDDLRKGLRNAVWPGRLETVSQSPRILLDGAHNPEGAASLAAALRETYKYDRLHLMMGMLSNKNHRDTLRHILPLVNTLIVTEPDFRKKMDADGLAELVREVANPLDFELVIEPDWRKAVLLLQEKTAPEDLAVVTGTLYLIADVRSRLLNNSDSEKGW
ncbi:bifunctional folylpolyglutamate synthase/dihydrofolate synthase [Paenibacillaceae bacterium]|nr:bifunctional folylpolyglutamate synthase/dihydrofolate synthase [Paenibacillaceae bacterium]